MGFHERHQAAAADGQQAGLVAIQAASFDAADEKRVAHGYAGRRSGGVELEGTRTGAAAFAIHRHGFRRVLAHRQVERMTINQGHRSDFASLASATSYGVSMLNLSTTWPLASLISANIWLRRMSVPLPGIRPRGERPARQFNHQLTLAGVAVGVEVEECGVEIEGVRLRLKAQNLQPRHILRRHARELLQVGYGEVAGAALHPPIGVGQLDESEWCAGCRRTSGTRAGR